MKLKDALNQDIPEPQEVLPPDYQAHIDRRMEKNNEYDGEQFLHDPMDYVNN